MGQRLNEETVRYNIPTPSEAVHKGQGPCATPGEDVPFPDLDPGCEPDLTWEDMDDQKTGTQIDPGLCGCCPPLRTRRSFSLGSPAFELLALPSPPPTSNCDFKQVEVPVRQWPAAPNRNEGVRAVVRHRGGAERRQAGVVGWTSKEGRRRGVRPRGARTVQARCLETPAGLWVHTHQQHTARLWQCSSRRVRARSAMGRTRGRENGRGQEEGDRVPWASGVRRGIYTCSPGGLAPGRAPKGFWPRRDAGERGVNGLDADAGREPPREFCRNDDGELIRTEMPRGDTGEVGAPVSEPVRRRRADAATAARMRRLAPWEVCWMSPLPSSSGSVSRSARTLLLRRSRGARGDVPAGGWVRREGDWPGGDRADWDWGGRRRGTRGATFRRELRAAGPSRLSRLSAAPEVVADMNPEAWRMWRSWGGRSWGAGGGGEAKWRWSKRRRRWALG